MLTLILFHACCIFHIKKNNIFAVGVVCYNMHEDSLNDNKILKNMRVSF